MKIMISQPMQGLSIEQIRQNREEVVKDLVAKGHDVVDSIINYIPPNIKNERVYCLAQSILIISKCDAVYFMKGFEKARGCMIEYEICKKYGIKIFNESDVSNKI